MKFLVIVLVSYPEHRPDLQSIPRTQEIMCEEIEVPVEDPTGNGITFLSRFNREVKAVGARAIKRQMDIFGEESSLPSLSSVSVVRM